MQLARTPDAYKVIRPELVPFISYPFEWCFSQLKDAALLTLDIQRTALEHGMSLKDASAYNVQFVHGRPVLIDTLSFEKYPAGRPWVAYRQFCQHFLAPLALMAHRDVRLNQLSRLFLDGVPLDLASSLLPARTRWRFSLLSHIHLHARSQKRYADKPVAGKTRPMSRFALLALLNSLETAVKKLSWRPRGSEWAEYYDHTNYSDQARDLKKNLVADFLQQLNPGHVCDIGANTGVFSRLAAERGIPTVALDIDAAAVEKNYLQVPPRRRKVHAAAGRRHHQSQPGHRLGKQRAPAAPAARSRSTWSWPWRWCITWPSPTTCRWPRSPIFSAASAATLVIEFIPKSDSQVRRLLATREDIFPGYSVAGFEKEFLAHFTIERREAIAGTERILYLMRSRAQGRE